MNRHDCLEYDDIEHTFGFVSLASPAACVASSMFFDAIVRDETRTAEAEAKFLVKAVRVMVRSMIAGVLGAGGIRIGRCYGLRVVWNVVNTL